MKNIFRILFAVFATVFVITSCEDEADRDWTTPEASFTLYDTTLGTATLYPSMESNPFTLKWEAVSGASEYTVEIASTETFDSPVTLGTSSTNVFTTTIGELNTAMLQAGLSPYTSNTAYIRVTTGSQVSNVISFSVTPYPAEVPVITAPTSGEEFILSAENESENATTINWSDYASYGVDVTYTVELAATGSDTYQTVGTVTNANSIALTVQELNALILKTGAEVGVQGDFNIRVTASTTSTGGTIEKTSEVVTIKVTPYESNVVLYLVGDATAAGWTNSADNASMFPLLNSHSQSTQYTYTGYFAAGGFKLIKTKGSWGEQYGKGDSDGTLSADGGSGNISVPSAGYYKFTADTSTLTYTLEAVTAPTSSYATVGIIGDATANGWDASTAMTQSTFDTHVWYLENVTLTDGSMKFRANNSWDVNWGSGDSDFGTATNGGDNIPVTAGTYTIYFNDYSGAYTLVKN